MEPFYIAFALFLVSIYLAGQYYKDPMKLTWIYVAIFVGLAFYNELDLYVSLLYGLIGVFGYVILYYWHQEGILRVYTPEKEQPIPYWMPVLIAQTMLTFVMFIRFYDVLEQR